MVHIGAWRVRASTVVHIRMYAAYRLPSDPLTPSPFDTPATAGILAPLLPVIFFDPSPILESKRRRRVFYAGNPLRIVHPMIRHHLASARRTKNGQYHFMADLIIGVCARYYRDRYHVTDYCMARRRPFWPR